MKLGAPSFTCKLAAFWSVLSHRAIPALSKYLMNSRFLWLFLASWSSIGISPMSVSTSMLNYMRVISTPPVLRLSAFTSRASVSLSLN